MCCILMLVGCGGGNKSDSDLYRLDKAIGNRDFYQSEKEKTLARMHEQVAESQEGTERFHALGHLLDEYISYNTDSALAICNRRLDLAERIGDEQLKVHANLSKAHLLATMGFYMEALDILNRYPKPLIPEYLVPYYYHINRTIYGFLGDYAMIPEDKLHYQELTSAYRDSLMMTNEEGGLYYTIIRGDQLNVHDRAAEAAELLSQYADNHEISAHEQAIMAFTLAQSYRLLGDKDNLKKQLIISATNDMTTGVKEYISLRDLALLLYEEGDIKHAYKYLNICMEDAQKCNARLRILEINDIFPIVNKVYLDTIEKQQFRLKWGLVVLCMLILLLLVTGYFIYRDKNKLSAAKKDVLDMNSRLQELNAELNRSNHLLLDANHSIAENSYLKTEYIARYMDQCSLYIEKLDKIHKQLTKIVATGSFEDVKKYVKSMKEIDDELKAFYANFDSTFLCLFPTFVEEFNALLQPGERIEPKAEGCLNTELRIFALIRLGITDSVKIAQFLRYSVTTIYNYRTRIRNKVAGNRDTLENDIMSIGKLPSKS